MKGNAKFASIQKRKSAAAKMAMGNSPGGASGSVSAGGGSAGGGGSVSGGGASQGGSVSRGSASQGGGRSRGGMQPVGPAPTMPTLRSGPGPDGAPLRAAGPDGAPASGVEANDGLSANGLRQAPPMPKPGFQGNSPLDNLRQHLSGAKDQNSYATRVKQAKELKDRNSHATKTKQADQLKSRMTNPAKQGKPSHPAPVLSEEVLQEQRIERARWARDVHGDGGAALRALGF